ncbi:hypothetical protein H632_c3394p0 [Helicosporidium sp. ATCC 50920]|nr:hypothetical protein H632_c3394p0 [Helicosporidium sp. ATCC 50920]|eukprot:KDD72401.1 hypothetical protein H632_c3394p0 [Helicosporidium sp. ATCC 50920]
MPTLLSPPAPLPDLRVPPGARAPPPLPILFFHGVGLGVTPYLHFVRSLTKTYPGHAMILLEVPHVSLRWSSKGATPVEAVVAEAVAALDALGAPRACVIAHSYGTFCAAQLLSHHRARVASLAVIDPVCMLACYPRLLANFIYRRPGLDNLTSLAGAMDMARYAVSRDLLVAHCFCRQFNWSALAIWPQDLPDRALVVLAGGDDLVPSPAVERYMHVVGRGRDVLYNPDLGHAGFLLFPGWQKRVIAAMHDLLE